MSMRVGRRSIHSAVLSNQVNENRESQRRSTRWPTRAELGFQRVDVIDDDLVVRVRTCGQAGFQSWLPRSAQVTSERC